MKKIILWLFYIIFFTAYPCKPLMLNYLKEAGMFEDNKNLELYSDSRENFNTNLIFKLNNKLYIYGKEFLTVNNKTYKYLGKGYYENDGTVYFFKNKVTKINKNDKIKTYSRSKEAEGYRGTSCDGQFRDTFYFLEINDVKYENGEYQSGKVEENFFISLFNKVLKIFKI